VARVFRSCPAPHASCYVLEKQGKAGNGAVKGLYILAGTGIKDTREWVPSATSALQLVRTHMKLRRPSVRIEDERGSPISFFQLKDMAEIESRKKKP
jgi:hypothetical protein